VSVLHEAAAQLLRRIDPELAHGLTLTALESGLGPRDAADDPILATRLCGLGLANPVGLAAGFDKDARAPRALLAAGFGFVECGTVTPRPQAGNPRPRLFRLAADRAVINRMGFNNAGLEAFAGRLAELGARPGPVGANVGANKDSADRAADYAAGLRRLWTGADYFTLNVSSPNTPGLRDLQHRSALAELLGSVAEARTALIAETGRDRPVLLKIAPDMTEAQALEIVAAARTFRLDGLVVSNTTIDRPATLASAARSEAGGLSGAPLFAPSTRLLRVLRQAAGEGGGGRLAIVGVGGVGGGAEAYAKIRAGADAVQLYTALAYEGPSLVRRIKDDLAARLRAEGFSSVAAAVGTG
jgi:dihydroorotate dehydrogenase